MNDKILMFLAALAVLILLVVTTPGWKEVLGLNINLPNFKQYSGLIILAIMMLGILGIVMFSKEENK